MNINEIIVGLPGEDMVRRGVADHNAGRVTIESYLVQIARPRMEDYGLLPPSKSVEVEHELELYRLLRSEGGDAYARYWASWSASRTRSTIACDGRKRRDWATDLFGTFRAH